jgi:hypothetical protein
MLAVAKKIGRSGKICEMLPSVVNEKRYHNSLFLTKK